MAKTTLWIPGPTEVRSEILAECARPMIGHRSKAMTTLMDRLDPHLRLAFGLESMSDAAVAVHTCSATGAMEASLLGVGPRVVCIVNGSFSQRYAEIAALVGKDVTTLAAPMGSQVPMAKIEEALATKGPFDALAIVSNETSSGVRTPLAGLAAVTRKFPATMVLVDMVSYIAGAPVDFDVHGIDFAFAGVQKAFALPPGITVLCASKRYLAQAASQPRRGFYLDPIKIVEGHVKRTTPATPCISLYFALAKQLEDISAGVVLSAEKRGVPGRAAWQARFDEHARMQRTTELWAAGHGLEMQPAAALRSPTISCVKAHDLVVADLIAGLKELGHEIGNGYGELKDKTFRIGHMGDHTNAALEAMLARASEVIARLRSSRARA